MNFFADTANVEDKWLLVYKDTNEAAQGARIDLVGENIDLNLM
ncbi:MAG: hypothetical protein RR415_10050 [Ruthenibacterium sp.]